jgi:hypothetical protein
MEEYRARLADLGNLAASKIGAGKPWTADVRQAAGKDVTVMTVTPPTYMTLEDALAAGRLAVRKAFIECSMQEHRATVTGDRKNADAYFSALGELDVALSRLWETEETGVARKRVEIDDMQGVLRARAQELLATSYSSSPTENSVSLRYEARAAHDEALNTTPLPDSAIYLVVTPPTVTYEDRRANAVRRATGKVAARVAGKVAARNKKRSPPKA